MLRLLQSTYKRRYHGKFQFVDLPALPDLVFAAVFWENFDGYADGDPMDHVSSRVGPDLAGSVSPPTWVAAERGARFTYSNNQYFRVRQSSALGTFNALNTAEASWSIHVVGRHVGGAPGLETLAANANLSTDKGFRYFRSSANGRINIYPDLVDETTGGWTNLTTKAVRTYTMHSNTGLDASFARQLTHQDGVNVGNDASAHIATNVPQDYDMLFGLLPGGSLALDGVWNAIFVQAAANGDAYDSDAGFCDMVTQWEAAL